MRNGAWSFSTALILLLSGLLYAEYKRKDWLWGHRLPAVPGLPWRWGIGVRQERQELPDGALALG